MNTYYLRTIETVAEETNDDGETTYTILSQISKDGGEWEECLLVTSDL